jgi:cytochrome c biogenesis protein CcmG, thiol:disulfide interchange protein DsbE
MSQVTMDSQPTGSPASPPASKKSGWQQRLRESRLGTVLVLAVTAAIVSAGAYLVDRDSAPVPGTTTAVELTGAGNGAAPKIGSPSQDFTATDVDGKKVSLSSYKGQPVWLTFGASWCAACVAEAADVEAAYKKFSGKKVVVLAVSISEDSATVKDYRDRVGLTYPQVADPNTDIASAYRVNGIPAHFFIDASGVLRSMKTGALSPDIMDTALTEISK